MAKAKIEKENIEQINTEVSEEKLSEATNTSASSPSSGNTTKGPTYEELAYLVQQLAGEVQALKQGNQQTQTAASNNDLASILTALTNRKSDKEVSIVHNCELIGGLTTHIELSNTKIDFSHVGETRLLSWQQFEECVSKYRSFFDKKIIMVAHEDAEVAMQYNVPYAGTQRVSLTPQTIAKLVTMTVPQLEEFITQLSEEDQSTVFSYWLGKCYTREPGFYDRHKMDTLNRLSNGMFDNILLVMNGDNRISFTDKQK